MGTIITFKRPDGNEASGYLANAAGGNAPGVVVIQEWWGLQDQIKGMCERFPALFEGAELKSPHVGWNSIDGLRPDSRLLRGVQDA